jgi:cytochrome c oxidase accessory protein FixG
MNNPDNQPLGEAPAKPDQPVSLTVAEPDTGNLRHEPHEPPRQDLPEKLFEKRRAVFPQPASGFYRNVKYLVMLITLGIYYVTPWIRWDRGPYAPDQAVLVDIANRRFYMFGIEIWPHEFYFVAGLLIMAGIGLFLVTSAVGRAWCGYSCPQTVWTDLFQHVDRLIDGDRNAQARLARAPWGPNKIFKRALKWSIFLVISFWTGGAWIMYFADAPTLVRDFWSGNAAPVAYITVAILTFTTFTLGGFLREQFCIYMCPWPRIQAAMMDERSLTVTYKDWRGEPRGSVKKAQRDPAHYGDCIDCMQCVAVCPTGIDIREGPQIGCITCALCIDACDRVMAEVGRPRGLIDYVTLEDSKLEAAGEPRRLPWRNLVRPRTVIYLGGWAAIGLAMLFALGARSHLDISAAADRNPPYMLMSDGSVRNAFTLKLRNMENRPRAVEISLSGVTGATMWNDEESRNAAAPTMRLNLQPDATRTARVYVIAPPDTPAQPLRFRLRSLDKEGASDESEVQFAAPGSEDQ